MKSMNLRLRPHDGAAIDLLLDKSISGSDIPTHMAPVDPLRTSAASKLLGLLQSMPTEEPTRDLLAQTLRRIERSSSLDDTQFDGGVRPLPFMLDSPLPHA